MEVDGREEREVQKGKKRGTGGARGGKQRNEGGKERKGTRIHTSPSSSKS